MEHPRLLTYVAPGRGLLRNPEFIAHDRDFAAVRSALAYQLDEWMRANNQPVRGLEEGAIYIFHWEGEDRAAMFKNGQVFFCSQSIGICVDLYLNTEMLNLTN